jgi:hypothetical protein
VAEDSYIGSIEAVEHAARALQDAVDGTVGMLRRARAARLHGTALREIVRQLLEEGGADVRLRADEALAGYTAAITAYRARTIQTLVDEGGMTLPEVAALLAVPEEQVASLYAAAP